MYDQFNYTRAFILIEKFVFDTGQCVVVTDMYDQFNYTRALILIEKFVFDTGQCVVGDRHV